MKIITDAIHHQDILNEIRDICRDNYGNTDIGVIESVYNDIIDLFAGRRKGFLKCDTKYHDLLHTLQVLLPFAGIISGWNKSGNSPGISKEYFEKGVIAVLLHDTGYIKADWDTEGTGAKYTFVHIHRSADFAGRYLSEKGFDEDSIKCITNIIMCTGVKLDFSDLSFSSGEERISGYALGTADLLGQMAAPNYVEKLPELFAEFNEAYDYEGRTELGKAGTIIFKSAEDLIRNTPYFYENVVKAMLSQMGSVYSYLSGNRNDADNYYIKAIEKNIDSINNRYPAG